MVQAQKSKDDWGVPVNDGAAFGVSLPQFVEFHTRLSARLDSDEYFGMVVRKMWKL